MTKDEEKMLYWLDVVNEGRKLYSKAMDELEGMGYDRQTIRDAADARLEALEKRERNELN